MKTKKILGIVLLLMILLGSTVVFAETESVSISDENTISEEELIPALEEKLKNNEIVSEENTTNTTNTTNENSVTNNTSNNAITNSVENSTNATSKEKRTTERKVLEDVYLMEDDNIVYSNTYINGNVYIMCSKTVTFTNCEISGNIFVMSEEFELENTEVTGSIYAFASNIEFIESKLVSVYAVAENMEIDKYTEIENDLKAIANQMSISGVIGRDAYISADYLEISDDSEIAGKCEVEVKEYDISTTVQKSDGFSIEIIIEDEDITAVSVEDLLPELLIEFVFILIVTIIILCTSPKFTEVNSKLKLRSFFKAFFTGILEIVIIIVIANVLLAIGYGVGIAFAVLLLMVGLLCFGKYVFIASFGIRLVQNANKNPRIKGFIYTIVVALVVEALNLISLLGNTGIIIALVINVILGITGFGTLMRVVFTSTKKNKDVIKNIENEEPKEITETPVEIEKVEEVQEENNPELAEEVETDVKEEKVEPDKKEEKTSNKKKTNNSEENDTKKKNKSSNKKE